MTHSGGLPHTNVGDRGQRYEIYCTGYPKCDAETRVGWAGTVEGADDMVSAFAQAPGARSIRVLDRVTKRSVTRYCGVLR